MNFAGLLYGDPEVSKCSSSMLEYKLGLVKDVFIFPLFNSINIK